MSDEALANVIIISIIIFIIALTAIGIKIYNSVTFNGGIYSNCGGPLPVNGLKCEFCGTRIIDLTMIDFDNDTPTMFVLKAPKYMAQDKDVYISMWARPELESITMESNTAYVINARGERLCPIDVSRSVAFQMSLHPYADPKSNKLYTLTIE